MSGDFLLALSRGLMAEWRFMKLVTGDLERGVNRPTFVRTMFSAASSARCFPVALVVGTVLSLINQGSVLFAGRATDATWLRIASNYAMPFLVSSVGFFLSQRQRRTSDEPDGTARGPGTDSAAPRWEAADA
jgi:hypothetical protein